VHHDGVHHSNTPFAALPKEYMSLFWVPEVSSKWVQAVVRLWSMVHILHSFASLSS
jgi:hypothetical protein